jgi:hypothetical protein
MFGPFFIPRNLTPDKTGRPGGGASFEEFLGIMRTGIDPDHAHPQFGPFLQVMPWPTFQNMIARDLSATYEYLSAIPCLEGDPGLPNPRPVGKRCKYVVRLFRTIWAREQVTFPVRCRPYPTVRPYGQIVALAERITSAEHRAVARLVGQR